MRLMDGAKFFIQVCRTHDKFIGLDELAELMDKTPTVEAIPVEWLRKYVDEHDEIVEEGLYWIVEGIIEDWEEENDLG